MKKWSLFVFIFACMLVISACGSKETDKQVDKSSSTNKEAVESTEIKIKHELDNKEVVLKRKPEKIVVLDFGVLDTLDSLGIEVAGVPQNAVPEYLKKYAGSEYANVGSLVEPDFEAIHGMKPDLIIIGDRQAEMYDEFKGIAPTIYMSIDFTNYMDSFTNNMETIAKIFNKEEQIEKELKEINEKVDSIKEKTKNLDAKTLIVMVNEGKISAYGPDSRYGGFIHDVAGYKAVDKDIEQARFGQSINFEYITEKNPDIIFVVDRSAVLNPNHVSAKQVLENELFKRTNAYKNDKVIYLDTEAWFYGGGLQSSKKMIEDTDAYWN
ncbi:ABC transporter [Sporosarcina sp. P13]|uniref:siderophore ABC transporter substrate-binding protein n=1 Tax=Sporosarcina sp. P13 TaxID=2048263 RepID=UPI000C168D84|nr:siderophore ABC transporter substrate-binding protein [Sporosarcina sp. P13]PIC63646.1 ABC transporter [Sporosarcina sp. P13]